MPKKHDDPPARFSGNGREQAREVLEEWRAWLTGALDTVESFAREKPVAALGISFLAGVILSALLRRRR